MFSLVSDSLSSERFFSFINELESTYPTANSEVHTLHPLWKDARNEYGVVCLSFFSEDAVAGNISLRGESISAISEVNLVRIESRWCPYNQTDESASPNVCLWTKAIFDALEGDNPGVSGVEIPLHAGTSEVTDEWLDGWCIFVTSIQTLGNERGYRIRFRGPSLDRVDTEEVERLSLDVQEQFLGFADRLSDFDFIPGYRLNGKTIGDSYLLITNKKEQVDEVISVVLSMFECSSIRESHFWFELAHRNIKWDKIYGDALEDKMPPVDGRSMPWIPQEILERYADPMHKVFTEHFKNGKLAVFLRVSGWKWEYEITNSSYIRLLTKDAFSLDYLYEIADHPEYGAMAIACFRHNERYRISICSLEDPNRRDSLEWLGLNFKKSTPPVVLNEKPNRNNTPSEENLCATRVHETAYRLKAHRESNGQDMLDWFSSL